MPAIPISSRAIPWIVLAVTFGTLAGAFFFQYALGLEPCPLCYTQRNPYYAALPIALLAGLAGRETNIGLFALALMGALVLIFAVSTGLGIHHAGVEYGWWEGPASCAAGPAFPGSVAELQAALEGAPRVARCDEVPWSFLGLSLAGYNVLISLALMGLSAIPLIRYRTGSGMEED